MRAYAPRVLRTAYFKAGFSRHYRGNRKTSAIGSIPKNLYKNLKEPPVWVALLVGAGDRNRTGTGYSPTGF